MSRLLNTLRQRAARLGRTIALPESSDPRVLSAAVEAYRTGLCRPLLIGDRSALQPVASQAGLTLPDDLEILEPATDPLRNSMTSAMERITEERGKPLSDVSTVALEALHYSCLLVRTGRAHGAVMGAVATTSDTLRAALRVCGVDPLHRLVTSCFLMILPHGRALVYADCGVIPSPSGEQLATIAILAAETFRLLVDEAPKVALLAFSTLGSATHESLGTVLRARDILQRKQTDGSLGFDFEGELQGDAALVPEVASRKAPGSSVAGRANVLIFPDLNSGNIAYKITERLAGARAIGPLLRGLACPIHDLSRGCSVDDLLDTIAITALEPPMQAAHRR